MTCGGVRRIEAERDDPDWLFNVNAIAEKAGTHLFADEQAVGRVVARQVVIVGGDERVGWGGVEGLEEVEGGLYWLILYFWGIVHFHFC